jgi:uncharacterized Zn-binding protein involved in type VI secretion
MGVYEVANYADLNAAQDSGGHIYLDGNVHNVGLLTVDAGVVLYARPGNGHYFQQFGGIIDIDSTSRMEIQGGSVNFESGTLHGKLVALNTAVTLDVAGVWDAGTELRLRGSDTFQGVIQAGQTVDIQGGPDYGHGDVTATGAISNHGILLFHTVSSGYIARLSMDVYQLSNDGTVAVTEDGGGHIFLNGDVTNLGTLDVAADTTLFVSPGNGRSFLTARQPGVQWGAGAIGQRARRIALQARRRKQARSVVLRARAHPPNTAEIFCPPRTMPASRKRTSVLAGWTLTSTMPLGASRNSATMG